MNEASKRPSDAHPSGDDSPTGKKRRRAVDCSEQQDGPHKQQDGTHTPKTENTVDSSYANAATTNVAAARYSETLTPSASHGTSSSGNEPIQTTAENNGSRQWQWAPSPMPPTSSYQKYRPLNNYSNVNLLDYHFSYLNDWIFQNERDVTVNLFQAGRKQNFGFMDNKFTMLYLPARPDNLANWLECFNRGASIKPAGVEQEGYTHYTWQSVVTLPRSNFTQQLRKKYTCHEKRGFIDAPIIEDHSTYPSPLQVHLDNVFPKIAALAGLRKDRRVPKGWISFSRGEVCRLSICRGNATSGTRESNRPKGLAFEGENQHVPVERPLFQVEIDVVGLHDLFCVIEGLLRTL